MDICQFNRIKSKFVTRTVGNELVIVPLSVNVAQMNKLFTLNETGKFIWESSDELTDPDSMATLIAENFEVDKEIALKDIEIFLAQVDDFLLNR